MIGDRERGNILKICKVKPELKCRKIITKWQQIYTSSENRVGFRRRVQDALHIMYTKCWRENSRKYDVWMVNGQYKSGGKTRENKIKFYINDGNGRSRCAPFQTHLIIHLSLIYYFISVLWLFGSILSDFSVCLCLLNFFVCCVQQLCAPQTHTTQRDTHARTYFKDFYLNFHRTFFYHFVSAVTLWSL